MPSKHWLASVPGWDVVPDAVMVELGALVDATMPHYHLEISRVAICIHRSDNYYVETWLFRTRMESKPGFWWGRSKTHKRGHFQIQDANSENMERYEVRTVDPTPLVASIRECRLALFPESEPPHA